MAQVREHLMSPQPHSGLKAGHMHTNWSSDATFKDGDVSGTLLFAGTSIVVYFNDRPDSHFHVDINDELLALLDAVRHGDCDVH